MIRARPLRAALLLALLTCPAGVAMANGLSSSTNGSAAAEVVAPLVVTREADLDFGTIFASSSAGTVTVSSGGAAAYGGGAQPACAGTACASPHAAAFAVRGEAGRSYAIAIPSSIVAIGSSSSPTGGIPPDLTVDALTVRTASRPASGVSGQLDANGVDRFTIGGTLQVPAGLASSHYRATITVSINYI